MQVYSVIIDVLVLIRSANHSTAIHILGTLLVEEQRDTNSYEKAASAKYGHF